MDFPHVVSDRALTGIVQQIERVIVHKHFPLNIKIESTHATKECGQTRNNISDLSTSPALPDFCS